MQSCGVSWNLNDVNEPNNIDGQYGWDDPVDGATAGNQQQVFRIMHVVQRSVYQAGISVVVPVMCIQCNGLRLIRHCG